MADDIKGRLKKIEETVGAVKRIKNEAKDIDFDWTLLLEEEPKLHLAWFIVSLVIYFVSCGSIIWLVEQGEKAYLFLFIVGMMSCLWLAVATYLRFRKVMVAAVVSLTAIIGLMVAARMMTPEQAAKEFKGGIQKKVEATKYSN